MKFSLPLWLAAAVFTAVPASAASVLNDSWLHAAATCAQGLNGGDLDQTRSAVTDCLTDSAMQIGADASFGWLNTKGKQRIGPGFAVTSRLRYAMQADNKVLGDIDLVLPLGAAKTRADANPSRAFFLQQGLTRWTDARSEVRNDMRFGGVVRFAGGGKRGGVYGLSAVAQENREFGHRRLVAGVDYIGAWGGGSLSWYRPITKWRLGRPGYEERALEGLDLALDLNLTTTLDLRATLGRWEQTADPDKVRTQASLNLDWRPHDYLSLGANLRDFGAAEGSETTWRAKLEIPLGGARKAKPQWRGFGLPAAGNAQPANIWRGLTHATRIEYAERKRQTAAGGRVIDGVTVRFLQSNAPSGSDIRVEIVLPAPADADTPLVVQLQPGAGDNPAAPGVDYVDEPVTAVVRAGDTSAIATIRLLSNPTLTAARTLKISVRAEG